MRLGLLLVFLAACHPSGTSTPDSDDTSPDDSTPPNDTGPDVNGRLVSIDGRDVLHLWGTRYELGYAEGALLCGRMTRLFEDYILNYFVADSGYSWSQIRALGLAMMDVPEGFEQEIRGIGDGMREHCPAEDLIVHSDYLGLGEGGSRELEIEDLIVANAVGDFACSSFTAWGEATAGGAMIHARNFDYGSDPGGTFLEEHLVKVYTSSEEGGARYLSVSTPGLVGCISCFTEEGTAFTMHNVVGLDSEENYGFVPRMLATRDALAATWGAEDPAAAAEAVLEAAPQYRGNALHLGWAANAQHTAGGAVFEYDGHQSHADGQATVREPGPSQGSLRTSDATISTNHYMQRTEQPTGGDSLERYDTMASGIDAAVARGGLDADEAFDLLDQVDRTWTAHITVYDASDDTLRLWVSEGPNRSATGATPITLDLGTLWDDDHE
ncbi:MAG: C45 family autoproteolytic acyltransferase/hydrolase [Pseudomonadota bacterium]